MNRRFLIIIYLCCGLSIAVAQKAGGQKKAAPSSAKAQSVLVDRVGDSGFIQLQAESFRSLQAKQQALAYWLTQAAIAIDPIIYDQLSAYALREKRLLEEIAARPQSIDPQTMKKIDDYAKLFWGNRGNDNENTAQKFLPDFTFDEAVSFLVSCGDQEEVDYYWAKLSEGGEEGPCGWLKDKYGVSWQVVPDAMGELMSDPDQGRAQRAMKAMLGMKKLDVAALYAAADQA